DCFVLATAFFIELSDAFKGEIGELPALEDLGDILTWSLRTCTADIVKDVDVGRVQSITFKLLPKGVGRIAAGDVIAVPGPRDKCYLGVFITKNRFGYAFGFFRGLWPRRPIKAGIKLQPCGRAVYTGKHALNECGWRVV